MSHVFAKTKRACRGHQLAVDSSLEEKKKPIKTEKNKRLWSIRVIGL